MSVTTFRSTDSGAPVLTGTSGGGLCALFDTCLVGSGTAYGALPKKGWSTEYTGTDKRVYRTVDGVAYLRVMHDGSQGAASYREAVVRGAEGASDVDTLTDAFPTTSDLADASCVWRVSTTADSTARPWILVADDNWFILMVNFGTNLADLYIFGEYSNSRSSNSWPYVINTRSAANSGTDAIAITCFTPVFDNVGSPKLFAMRNPNGISKSPRAAFVSESANYTGTLAAPAGRRGPTLPDPDGLIFISPPQIWVNGTSGASVSDARNAGFFPNLWSFMHDAFAGGSTAVYGDVFNAAGYDPSAQFIVSGGAAAASSCRVCVELTDTWQDPLA